MGERGKVAEQQTSAPSTAPTAYVTPLFLPVSLALLTLPATHKSELNTAQISKMSIPQMRARTCPCRSGPRSRLRPA